MNTTTQHTPTPWAARGRGAVAWIYSEANKHNIVDSGAITMDDAAFIVTACNAHDANVARVAELEAALREIYDQSINALELGAKGKGFFEDVRDACSAALKGAK